MIFFCIADKESSLGFKLAGVETREVSCRAETLEALQTALAVQDVGVIVITDKAVSWIEDEMKKFRYRLQLPLILEVPSRGVQARRTNAGDFLKQAAGISI